MALLWDPGIRLIEEFRRTFELDENDFIDLDGSSPYAPEISLQFVEHIKEQIENMARIGHMKIGAQS